MTKEDTKQMIEQKKIKTSRLTTAYLETGNPSGGLFILVHGNVSSADFFKPILAKLPQDFRLLAPDMRGFGDTETLGVDATRGVKDFSDDLHAFIQALSPSSEKVHLLGWSVGGVVIMQFALDYPDLVASLTLQAPMSPFGFGGSKNKGIELEACAPDFAGSGGGTTNLPFIDCIRTRDGEIRSAQVAGAQCNIQSHARTTMNTFYFKMINGRSLLQRNIIDKATEDLFTESMYSTKLGEENYPGNYKVSTNWSNVAPGDSGINNAISPKYCNLSSFANAKTQAPVLWIRGADDQIVSDTSFLDLNYLGSLGIVPGWPGSNTHPPQPMVTQTRAVLDAYKLNGGSYEEIVLSDCGHSPHIEQEEKFISTLTDFLGKKV